ncbi:MAG: MFS transporter, partial [Hydrogenophaga sp.]|nr:MFS transporter [Hydrogenophaga sp.]
MASTAVAWHTRHRFLLAFALLSLFMGISVGLAKVTTSLYAIHLGASGWWLGAIAAAQSVGILLTGLPMGHWVERFGPRRLFMAGSLAGGLLYALLPLVPSSGFLLAMTALTGVVMPTRFVSLQMIFMTMLHQIGTAHAGWQRAAHMSGMLLLGPLITAFVIQQVGHAGSYWIVALMFLLTIGLSQGVLRQPLPERVAPAHPAGLRAGLVNLLSHAEARRLAATEAGIQGLNMY